MIPYILLALGASLLTMSAIVLIWPRVRVLRLQNDLLELRVVALEAAGEEYDCAHQYIDRAVSSLIAGADLLTMTDFLMDELNARKRPSGEQDEFDQAMAQSAEAKWLATCVEYRLIRFYLFETFSGALMSAVALTILGWRHFKEAWFSITKTPSAFATAFDRRHCAAR